MTPQAEILIVDDTPANLQLLARILSGQGYRVRAASDGYLALDSVSIKIPDLILLDVKMPEIDGYEVCRRLKADPKTQGIPVLFISALEETIEKIRGFEAGGLDFISKPFSEAEVLARIEVHLKLKDLSESLEQKVRERTDALSKINLELQAEITERIQIEAALRESEKKYRTLVENIPQRIFTKDLLSVYQSCNDNFAKDLGIPADTIAGKTDHDFFPESLALKYRADDQRVMATGQTEGMEEEYCLNGETQWAYTIKTPVRDSNGNITGVLGIFSNITKQKLAEKEKEKIQEQLVQAQKMESVGRLAGGIAHDFNNMLGIILGNIDLLTSQMPRDAEPRELTDIRNAAEKAASLTRQLLAFSRKQTISPRILDLNETMESMLKMLRRLIGENISLIWYPGVCLWPIKIDPSQLDQILANLCVNARDAIANVGSITMETANISLETTYEWDKWEIPSGDYVLLTVNDNGCGMDPETRIQAFEPFFTTKGPGKGTGLGLSTVYGIIRQNNGYIHVYSEMGKGTSFKVYLPRCKEPATQEKPKTAPAILKGQGEIVLLVEDEPALLEMTKKMIEALGYSVLTAASPEEALGIAESQDQEIHILQTDMVMPNMNGHDLAKRIKAIRPGLRCIYMSGYAPNVFSDEGDLDDMARFIQKPFSISELADKLKKTMEA